jgi:hypothetical protein
MTDQWKCACCGLDRTSPKIKLLVEQLRIPFPDLYVVSGTRCEKHNAEIKGSKDSPHLPKWGASAESLAVDLGLKDGWTNGRWKTFFFTAIRAGASGIYDHRKKGAVHIDIKDRLSVGRYLADGSIEYLV